MHEPIVSIIVPTYNEEDDIETTLDALTSLTYRKTEVIIVDSASTDNTVQIVKRFIENDKSIKLYCESERRGVSSARNLGIKKANGEIIVILNADVIIPSNFIERILPHYENGADFVLVDSEVKNTEHLFPRWIQAQHRFFYDGRDDILWSEGFSCRKYAALSSGLFPKELASNTAGEDAVFGGKLEAKFRKVIDRSIVVPHMAPHKFDVFWRQRIGRGRGTPYRMYFVDKLGLPVIAYHLVKYSMWSFIQTILVFPLFITAFRLAKFSSLKYKDILPFMYAGLVDKLGQRLGEWGAFFEIRSRSG